MSTNFISPGKAKISTPNHAQPKAIKSVKKSSSKKQIFKWISVIIGVIILLLIILGLFNYSAAKNLYQSALAAKDDFLLAQEQVTSQDFVGATASLESANKNFTLAEKYSSKLWEFKIFPYLHRQFVAVDNLIVIGTQLSSALGKLTELGDEMFAILEEDGQVSFAEITEAQKKSILEKLYQAPPDLQGVKAEVDLAAIAFKQIPASGLMGPLKEAIEPIQTYFPDIQELIDRAVPVIQILPSAAGYPNEKIYLFLMQNNAELRPTGGFIGTYGIVKVQNGEIKEFMTDNIYNLDNPADDYLHETPPWQYTKYMASSQWLMRDSNWSADFQEAAQKTLWFYEQEGGPEEKIDGVIAVTPDFIKSLIELVGSVTVDGIEFTPENFVEIIQYEVEQAFWQKGISDEERKAIIGRIGEKLMDELFALPREEWQNLWAVFVRDIASKQIFMYFEDDYLQQVAEDENWAGRIQQTESDYLFIVDCNLASLKTDPGVIRDYTYTITEENGDYIADLVIDYKNEGTFNWKSTRLRTYTRVFVPAGSELLSYTGIMENDNLHGGGEGEVEITNELGKTVFGGFISIEPNATGSIHYRYKLPERIFTDYSLYFQKQGGTAAHGINLDLSPQQKINSVTTLDNYQLLDNNNKLTWTGILDQDLMIEFNVE